MKRTIYSFIALISFAFMFSSCGDNGTPIIPGGGGDNGDHPELWHYNGKIKGLDDIVPAIDENGNIYFAGTEQGMAGGAIHFVSVDKNGNERWDKTIDAIASSYVVYSDGKVFLGTEEPVTIHTYDANSGNEIWVKDYSADYDFEWMPSLAYTNNKLYVTSGQYTEGFLFVLNPADGTELWIKRLFDKNFISIAVNGNKIYVGGMGEVTRFDDNGADCDSIWHWEADYKNGSRYFAFSDINIADNGNIYFREDTKVYILSSETGQAVTTVELGTDFDNSSSGLTIDDEGNFFIGNGAWYKYSNSGDLVWKTDINTGLISPNYINAPVIAENGNLYNGELFSLSCVKPDGTLNWVLGTENGVGNLHPVVIDHDGNIITYSPEKGVLYCYKGDGSKLATNGWPKRYGNMGNTCSK
jgi:outer membrane protein assembly factor BamB